MEQINDAYSNITTALGASPIDFDLAIIWIDKKGDSVFSRQVLTSYGYKLDILKKIDLSEGFYLLEEERKKSVLFILTLSNRIFTNSSASNLKKQLRLVLAKHEYNWKYIKVWLPLPIVNYTRLSFEKSYFNISDIIKDYPNFDFTIVIPNDERGIEFVNNYPVYNLLESKREPRSSKSKSNIFKGNTKTTKGPPPPPGFSEDDEDSVDKSIHVGTDKIPFHLDLVEDDDKLSREPIARSLTRLLNNQIFKGNITKKETRKSNFAFMVHLQGAWGDGKSTFLNLIRKNLNNKTNKWIVIDFNAWQHQHISPPWWPFLDQIYQQSIQQIPPRMASHLWFCEQWRRLIKYKGFSRLITFGLVVLFSILIIRFYPLIFEFAERINQVNSEKSINSKSTLKFLFEIIVGIGSLLGLFYTLANFLSKPFFISSPETAKTFLEHATDPMQKIKKHFQSLIKNNETCGFRTAIFIDDLDRCNAQFTVQLLEGIQTLFRDKQVLYIVAGDKHWISTCFENHYEKYNDVVKEPTQKLGYLFLEKAFQLSLRLPNVSGEIKEDYWKYILQIKQQKDHSKEDIDKDRRETIIEEIQKEHKTEDYSSSEVIQGFKEKYDLNEEQATDITLEILDKDNEDVNHVLQEHFDLLDTNPRGIKRLANQYNIYRNTLIAEGKTFNRDKLFRWIILQNKYPVFTDWLEFKLDTISGDIKDVQDWKEEISKDTLWKKLIHDQSNTKGGKLLIDDIKAFTGLLKN